MAIAGKHPEFESEQAFLRYAARCLKQSRASMRRLPSAGGDAKAVAALGRMAADALGAMSRFRNLCVGRIDLEEGEQYHIGPQIIWDGIKPVVISWAAPIAAPFYTASPADPLGLSLRRRLQTEYDRLLDIRDEIFRPLPLTPTDPSARAVAAQDAEPTIDDLLLKELGRERTGAMHEIVATIQREQYRIITAASDTTTIVQGAPGTGKTIVGLHRAAQQQVRAVPTGYM